MIEQVTAKDSTQIAVVDCPFTEKSGRHTYGLDWFYSGKTQRAEPGLEWSVVAIVDPGQCQFDGPDIGKSCTFIDSTGGAIH